MSDAPPKSQGRATIIEAVQTPLGFFVLVVLLVEAIFGVVAVRFEAGPDRTFIIQWMVGIIIALVVVVAAIAVWRPSSLLGRDRPHESSPSLFLGPPKDLSNFDVTSISWNNAECFLICGDAKYRVTLVPAKIGPSFRVHIEPKILGRLRAEALSLDLKDAKGNRWQVRPFFLFEHLLPLVPIEDRAKIIQDYAEDEQ